MFENAPTAHVSKDEEVFLVLEENWPAINLFLQCQTQWNFLSGMSVVRTGFNYSAVETVMRLNFSDYDHSDLFSRLQTMESEALSIFNAEN